MRFEKVYTVRDFFDVVRSGTADFSGIAHYFSSVFDEALDDYAGHFRLHPVSAQFMERERRYWAIFKTWEGKFHRGLLPLETHPGHGGVDAEFDELSEWLDDQIKFLVPLSLLYTATFRVVPDREEKPVGVFRELEVAWTPVPS